MSSSDAHIVVKDSTESDKSQTNPRNSLIAGFISMSTPRQSFSASKCKNVDIPCNKKKLTGFISNYLMTPERERILGSRLGFCGDGSRTGLILSCTQTPIREFQNSVQLHEMGMHHLLHEFCLAFSCIGCYMFRLLNIQQLQDWRSSTEVRWPLHPARDVLLAVQKYF